MSHSPFAELGLARVINASGKMTALGGSAQAPEVAEALARAAQHHVQLSALRRRAGEILAGRTGAEAACVTTGAAAGIAMGVAAMITGTDRALVERLPDTRGLANRIVLMAGHDVHFGARISQMIRLGGGCPVPAGSPASVRREDVQRVLGSHTAGLLFVQSHHTRQADGLTLAEFVAVARDHDLPVLVDAAAEEDLERFVAEGADLVTYSGGKAFGGPTVGFIAGRRELIHACELQNVGIARPMKVGKEQIMGLLAALDRYPAEASWPDRLARLEAGLSGLPGMAVSIEADLAHRPIRRLGLRAPPDALKELVRGLVEGDPSIHTRNHHLQEGLLLFDLREVSDGDVPVIIRRVRELLGAGPEPARSGHGHAG